MSSELKPYPKMKDSGVKELGPVPDHWEVRQLGRIGRFSKGRGGTKDDEVESGIPCVRYGDLYTSHRFFIEVSRSFVSLERAKSYTPISYGDVLFAASGETIEEIGKSAVNLIGPACSGGDVVIWRPSISVDARFSGLATDCAPAAYQKSCMGRGITVMHIYGDELKCLGVALPPRLEQEAIVRYLDYVARRVRRLVRAKRKLIALLNEQKQAIIHRAVTRGLDPDVPLKDSGVEWLGQVPEHWDLLRGKYVGRLFSTPSIPDENLIEGCDDLPMYLKVSDLANVDRSFRLRKSAMYVRDDALLPVCEVRGCVVFPKRGGAIYTNKVAIVEKRFVLDPNLMGWAIAERFDPQYVALLLKTRTLADLADVSSVPQINNKHIYPVVFPAPSLREQRAILSWLEADLAGLVALASSVQSEITLLSEYRTRLIADVVTGKLDVREAAAALPEVDPLEAEDEADAAGVDLETELDDFDLEPDEVEV